MTVQHLHVVEGGQAIVGSITAASEGALSAKKVENNPMHLDMHRAPRCRATSKRSGKQCQSPAVREHEVCRMHGAGGGGPKGNRNAWKHGEAGGEALALKTEIQTLARIARQTMTELLP